MPQDEYDELPDEAATCLPPDDPNKAVDDAADDDPCGDFAPDELGGDDGVPG